MPAVISCSRRTDVPAFYSAWLMNRLRAGFCHTLNPFGGQVYRVSLTPEDVIALAFWTRNPGPMAQHLDELEDRGYRFYFSVTLTGYENPFEPHSPPLESAVQTFQKFSHRLSPEQMRWRYDPIVLSSATPEEYHLQRFSQIAQALEGSTRHCTFSFVQFYGKTKRNLGEAAHKAGIEVQSPGLEQQQLLARQLARIAHQYGMSFNTCCNDLLLVDGVTKSHCIDLDLIQAIAPDKAAKLKAKPTRPDCGCAASVDIGMYDTCLFGCAYCYATRQVEAARLNHSQHDPRDTILWRPENQRKTNLDQVATLLQSR